MSLLLLVIATAAVVVGSFALASWVERSSPGRLLLLFAVLVPAHITVVVLGVGWMFASLRPVPIVVAALTIGAVELGLLWMQPEARGAVDLRAALANLVAELRSDQPTQALVAIAASFVGWQGLRALRLPVTAYDSLTYRLPEPSTWVLRGRVVRSGLTMYGDGYPMGQEVLHSWTMVQLHSIRGTGLVVLWLVALGGLAVHRLARHLGAPSSTAVFGAALFCAIPAVALQIGTTYVDAGGAALALAALSLALDARRSDRPLPLFLVASAAAGLAFATKPSLAFVVLAVAVIGVLVSRRAQRAGASWSSLARCWVACTAVVVVVGGCWYVDAVVRHGNPIYPVSMAGLDGEGSHQKVVLGTNEPAELEGASVPVALWRSWTTDLTVHEFGYDQRMGGLGAVWVVVGIPALAVLVARRSHDRFVVAILVGTALAAWVATGATWWARYSLLLAGVGCVAVAVGLDDLQRAVRGSTRRIRRRTRAVPRVASTAVVALAAFSAFSAWSPADVQVVEAGESAGHPSAVDLAQTMWAGDGERSLSPWARYRGLGEAESGRSIAALKRDVPRMRQALIGVDLDHPLVIVEPPRSAADLHAQLVARGVGYLYLPDGTDAGSVEAAAVANPVHFRPFSPDEPIPGGKLWELGAFEPCADVELKLEVFGGAAVASGHLRDGCGPVADATVVVWRAGSSGSSPWAGAKVAAKVVTGGDGRFEVDLEGSADLGARWFANVVGRWDRDGYRSPTASPVTVAID